MSDETKQVWVITIASRKSLIKEVDSVHSSEESAIVASDLLYDHIGPDFEVSIEPFEVENFEY